MDHKKGRDKQAARRERRREVEYTGEDFAALCRQLRPLGLSVVEMDKDGNCLFRAIADQLLGDAEEWGQLREECCDFMTENAEEFQLFHADDEFEDEETFESYVEHMRSPGRWGSQLELMALCRRHEINAILHQHERSAYEMVCAPLGNRCIQLSYHDGEHYNSVRFSSDLVPGRAAKTLTLEQIRGKGAQETDETRAVREQLPDDFSVTTAELHAALGAAGGDVEAAAERLLARAAGAAEPGEEAKRPADASAEEAAAKEGAEEAVNAEDGPTTRSKERKKERRRAKEAKEQRRREKRTDGAAEEDALEKLSKSLLAV